MAPLPRKRRLARRLILRRIVPFLLADAVLAALSLYAALLLRFEGDILPRYLDVFPPCAALVACIQVVFLMVLDLYQAQWRYASLRELLRVVYSSGLSLLTFSLLLTLTQIGGEPQVLPRSVLAMQFLISTAALGGLRLLPRILAHAPTRTAGRKPALIYGAGAAGEQLVRDMLRHDEYPYFPAGFIDDDPRKWGTTIHGVRVLGDGKHLAAAAAATGAETLIVAIPSAAARQVRRLIQQARTAEITETKILPALDQIVSGQVTVSLIREIDLEDLMGREPVEIDTGAIEGYLREKRILVTGAAGSIGSELARLVLGFAPARVCLLDHDETELFHLAERIGPEARRAVELQIADVRDAERIDAVLRDFQPDVVFHAAAYKHVPMIERHPAEAAKTNVTGTCNVARAAERHGCGKFILISTDKAVNPSSVMGVSKRIAEMVIREQGRRSRCRFAAVRFGNVLGSRGSVVPLFREQIARGGPVTVTHAEMKRYFMTAHEACLLVLQASALASGGEVFVLDMGEPVKIVDLAREMIRLSGFEPDADIRIEITGVRPGEKLFEEYLTAEEGVDATKHEKIFVAKITQDSSGDVFAARLAELEEACAAGDPQRLQRIFREIVPTYQSAGAREPAPQGDSAR